MSSDPLVKAVEEHAEKNKKKCERCAKVEVPELDQFFCEACKKNPLWPK